MAKIFKSRFILVKRYARFSNTCIYLRQNRRKRVRFGYKVYQKIFRRYRSKKALRINVRKPRISVKRKTQFGKALEIKEKFTYLLRGIHAGKLRKYVHLSRAKIYSPMRELLTKLESRLDIMLYRINIIFNPFFTTSIVKAGYAYVNGKKKVKPSFFVKRGHYVDFKPPVYLYRLLKKRFKIIIKKKLIFKPFNRGYVELSYKIFRIIRHTNPTERIVFYPFDFKPYYFFRLYSK